jgi:hypothetical protein
MLTASILTTLTLKRDADPGPLILKFFPSHRIPHNLLLLHPKDLGLVIARCSANVVECHSAAGDKQALKEWIEGRIGDEDRKIGVKE